MCLTHLKVTRDDIDPEDIPKYFDNVHSTAKQLLEFVGHCEADCYFQMAVAFKVQALPLTRQLTTLAGNSWSVFFLLPFFPLVILTWFLGKLGTRRWQEIERNETSSFFYIDSTSEVTSVLTRFCRGRRRR